MRIRRKDKRNVPALVKAGRTRSMSTSQSKDFHRDKASFAENLTLYFHGVLHSLLYNTPLYSGTYCHLSRKSDREKNATGPNVEDMMGNLWLPPHTWSGRGIFLNSHWFGQSDMNCPPQRVQVHSEKTAVPLSCLNLVRLKEDLTAFHLLLRI